MWVEASMLTSDASQRLWQERRALTIILEVNNRMGSVGLSVLYQAHQKSFGSMQSNVFSMRMNFGTWRCCKPPFTHVNCST